MANLLFGTKGFLLIAGHCPTYSGYKESKLYKHDKYSWLLQPRLIHKAVLLVEPQIACGQNWDEHIDRFLKKVREGFEKGKPVETHQLYLEWKELADN